MKHKKQRRRNLRRKRKKRAEAATTGATPTTPQIEADEPTRAHPQRPGDTSREDPHDSAPGQGTP